MLELATASLRQTGRLRLRVTGASMLPAIRPGDVLEVRSMGIDAVRGGDVVLFARDGRFFAHRVVRRGISSLVTRGDALESDDAPFGEAELLGAVVAVQRRGRDKNPDATLAGRAAAQVFRRSPLAGRLFTRWFAAA
ncbi:MAG TPA: S24/S26 family peptidase [Usitatibacter sp.]|nr:S24/S26 family peptidase [Usitatibacter sp.]